jgi:hypothetical protein
MADTPEIRASQATALSLNEGEPGLNLSQATALSLNEGNPDLNLSHFSLLTCFNLPTLQVDTSQLSSLLTVSWSFPFRVSHASVLVAVIGKPEIRKARAWAFSLDGHDFYVLRLGESSSLVYDLTTNSWSTWANKGISTWRLHLGLNWLSIDKANYLGGAATNVVGGDDNFGLLWTLDPNNGLDDSPIEENPPEDFERRVSGGVPARMRQSVRNNAVFLVINTGNPAFVPAAITLYTSDDNGKSFQDQGSIDVPAGEDSAEIMWRSLGLIRAPGRIFEFRDTGATVRIDGLDVRLNGDTQDG